MPEASCRSQIRTAQAVASEFGEVASSSGGVSKWARISLSNSERDVQQVVQNQGTKLMVPITTIVADGVEIPWISPIDWLQFIVDRGLWHRLAGLTQNDKHMSPHVWSQFWDMQRKLQPHNSLFDEDNLRIAGDLGNVAAFYIHGDEGRTLKKHGIMITTLQSVLGFGFDDGRMKRNHDGTLRLRCNYVGHTFTTRFVLGAIPKKYYESNPKVFGATMDILSQQLEKLFCEGVYCKRTKQTYRICILGVKGDWPYLQKCGNLTRAFNTGVKRGTTNKAPKGTCHLCLSGYNDQFPGEEIDTNRPQWLQTVGTLNPWDHTPPLVRRLCHDRSHPASFFQGDPWHTFHLGVGKSFVASTIQLCLQVMGGNLDAKWEWLTDNYTAFCKREKRQSHVAKITGYLMSYGDKTGAVGAWSKGGLTTNLMKWLPHLIEQLPADQEGLLQKCSRAAKDVNLLFAHLFSSPAFLDRNEAIYMSGLGASFLRVYAELALVCFRKRHPYLFPMYPKLHSLHHMVLDLEFSAHRCGFAASPLLTACQQDEDVVGRCSRLSRRVSARLTMRRTLERYLIQCHVAWVSARMINV